MTNLPTGTVTLLLADVEGSTRLWETRADEMTAAVARLDRTVTELVATHRGVRPVEQGEGDSFVIAFARAGDAVACALDLQRATPTPITLRIGVHTGDVQLRDEGNYIGPTINRTARLRDLAHGGQTVLSGATEELVTDQLPDGVSFTDLGTYPLRDLPRPERVLQLCDPDLRTEFPPLRVYGTAGVHHLPIQLTNFVGRDTETRHLREALMANRLVTLTGTGGVGKTRLAVQVATELAGEFSDGVCYVDLAPITHRAAVPVTAARALGLPDQPGRSTMDTLLKFVRDRQMLVVLDNCEHLLDASATLVVGLLGGAARITVLATSREQLGVAGEATWQVPSLSLVDEAVELFADRARLARTDFTITDDNAATVAEICRRLDGIPLAIELAAARVRSLTPADIVGGLHDRFRLLTGGSRTAMRRQQTLRASVEWSHALLTETERVLFRRVAVFLGGFDLDAAQAVDGGDLDRYQMLDQLSLLVDKSLVVAEEHRGRTRYRLLETVRQYALEKLAASGEADAVRSRHRDHYTSSVAARLDAPARADYEQYIERAEIEMDNLRGALGWNLENHETEFALALGSSLQPLWLTRGRVLEGRAWFNAVPDNFDEVDVAAAVRARALADRAVLDIMVASAASLDEARRALAIARELDDPALLARALTACGCTAGYSDDAEAASTFLAEAAGLARSSDDRWQLSQILAWQGSTAATAGYPIAAAEAAEEGLALADATGNLSGSRLCRQTLGWAKLMLGNVPEAIAQFGAVVSAAEAAHDNLMAGASLLGLSFAHAYRGEVSAARSAAGACLEVATGIGEYFVGMACGAAAVTALAAGAVAAARESSEAGTEHLSATHPELAAIQQAHSGIEAVLAGGDLVTARRSADDTVAMVTGWSLAAALLARARVAVAEGEPVAAEHDALDALACAAGSGVYLPLPDILECLADLAGRAGSRQRAARLFGAAESFRQRTGVVRFEVHQASYEASVDGLRETLGGNAFNAAWTEGAALSTEEAIAYARRGHAERGRPASGWDSLTPAEHDVVRLVGDGLGNKEIAARLFVSPRTVQSHLTHVFAKLDLTSRVQLVREASRHEQ
ncbi:LuxR C-terminal-related transcriptional regulator [Rhodococcus sp. NPDC058514]|uniref:helix-turn-helix transcriptional regulator n=1 Tax=Rhodococcus sp. NPDC058514 TaxID=3346532 RepID=UPI003650FD6B